VYASRNEALWKGAMNGRKQAAWLLGCVGVSQPDPTVKPQVTTAKPPARYGAI